MKLLENSRKTLFFDTHRSSEILFFWRYGFSRRGGMCFSFGPCVDLIMHIPFAHVFLRIDRLTPQWALNSEKIRQILGEPKECHQILVLFFWEGPFRKYYILFIVIALFLHL